MPDSKYSTYTGTAPYFELVRKALGDLVDGDHFFDIVADDIVYEVRYDLGWPRGRGPHNSITLRSGLRMKTET